MTGTLSETRVRRSLAPSSGERDWEESTEYSVLSIPYSVGAGKLRPVLRRVGLLLLAGYLLFSHGCHGDEDNELFCQSSVVRDWSPGFTRLKPGLQPGQTGN